ncbi:uncharacterized protein LOC118430544 isoform X1 [Branchiostoma floridae]|uniref:Uncharacterized protein LOC118430544 isoform X1 n=1 Tax=Branchiostoma floridae TaxID=7739 RepID=A0A9J7MB69_BRAFL|nr:uncharacterized protein LOC118430544 isoform X1 [Branchiostoma floridae]
MMVHEFKSKMSLGRRSKGFWALFATLVILLGFSVNLFSPGTANVMKKSIPTSVWSHFDTTSCLHRAVETCMEEDGKEHYESKSSRNILLDCGGNVASTVELFKETYPGGREFIIHSFEMDPRLAPYFAAYPDAVFHNPVAVSNKDSFTMSYLETVWFPERSLRKNKDGMMGGGTIFAYDDEKKDNKTGGARNLSRHIRVKTIDFSKWLRENIHEEDYVIFKLDVEGAEYDILQKMVDDGTFHLIDKFYGECHFWHPTGWNEHQRQELLKKIKTIGFTKTYWAGEERTYADFDDLHQSQVTYDAPGIGGQVLSTCSPSSSGELSVSVVVQVGMNLKSARKLVTTLQAYPKRFPITLFMYGDFAESHPEVLREWASYFNIGMRENQPYPYGIFEMQNFNITRESIVSSEMRLNEVGIPVYYYLPDAIQGRIKTIAQKRKLRIVVPTVIFPPKENGILTWDNYHQHHDVARVPKALRLIDSQLMNSGGILCLDSDFPDSVMISVFLMDYLVEMSQYELVNLDKCF